MRECKGGLQHQESDKKSEAIAGIFNEVNDGYDENHCLKAGMTKKIFCKLTKALNIKLVNPQNQRQSFSKEEKNILVLARLYNIQRERFSGFALAKQKKKNNLIDAKLDDVLSYLSFRQFTQDEVSVLENDRRRS